MPGVVVFIARITACCALLLLSAGAQESTHRFRVLSWDSVITDLLYMKSPTTAVSLTILPNVRSVYYSHTGDGPLVFAREARDDRNKVVYNPAAIVPSSQLHPGTLLLLFPSRQKPGDYEAVAMNDDNRSIPPGGYCFYNFTTALLQVDCGGRKSLVPPKKSATIAGAPENGGDIQSIGILAKSGDTAVRVYANRWPYGRTTRTLVLMYRSEETGDFELKRLHEDAAVSADQPATRP